MGLAGTLDNFCDAALALVFPQPCSACGVRSVEARADSPACVECWQRTRLFDGGETICWKCGALAFASLPEEKRPQVRCRRCDSEAFTAARACGLYEGALRAAILDLKREPFVSARVARLLEGARRREPLDSATLVVPVPLHAERERERGFNQAAVLARTLSRCSGLPSDEHSLVRVAHSERHRAGMDARARRETVEYAFAVSRPRLVEGRKVLLIDDVFTTGATASACARVLRDAGAEDVFVLTVARA